MYENLKSLLDDHWKKNAHLGREVIRKQFLDLGAPERSLDRWLESLELNGTLKRKSGSGRPVKIATPDNIASIKNYFENKSGRSQKVMSRRLKCHRTTVGKILKNTRRSGVLKKPKDLK